MNWTPRECRAGDLIRVNLGAFYHYGIFVTETNIIQFGLPPIPQNLLPSEQIVVLSTDMDTFSCGKIVEAADYTKKEKKARFSDAEIVKRATARLGEGGYSLLHNNCEHFVNDCAFGKPFCSVEADAVRRWNNRPIFDIYVMPIAENTLKETFSCEQRMQELAKINNADLRREKQATWTLLELALKRSFNKSADTMDFKRNPFGKWTADGVYFSLSHTKDYAAVVVSNCACGVDLEIAAERNRRFSAEKLAKMKRRIACEGESDNEFLSLWTKKEALYKCRGTGLFAPQRIAADDAACKTEYLAPFDAVLSYCGASMQKARIYLVRGNQAKIRNCEDEEPCKPC